MQDSMEGGKVYSLINLTSTKKISYISPFHLFPFLLKKINILVISLSLIPFVSFGFSLYLARLSFSL
ncbi:hypothetical protein L6452_39724 [Arctium lappa]|uniref:Uncharacterized protein n=1 Tax=Arctium lappa TaxID=4217 RepID=A0ACB8XTT4_ARCLA|nr:hypothetical protein L6452_39724 [Arctium lappa]